MRKWAALSGQVALLAITTAAGILLAVVVIGRYAAGDLTLREGAVASLLLLIEAWAVIHLSRRIFRTLLANPPATATGGTQP